MNETYITTELLAQYAQQLYEEEKSSVTIEKYIRDVRTFSKYAGSQALTKDLTIAYKRDLPTRGYQNENVTEQYAVLTVSFGDFLTMKNCAFIDTNNCPFAPQLLSDKIAQDTGHSKISGYCEYPLWVFKEDFLKEIGVEKYEQYSEQFDAYMRREMSEDDMKLDEMCGM